MEQKTFEHGRFVGTGSQWHPPRKMKQFGIVYIAYDEFDRPIMLDREVVKAKTLEEVWRYASVTQRSLQGDSITVEVTELRDCDH